MRVMRLEAILIAFDGSQRIFPFQHVAWREVKNDSKLCFFIMGM
jgi:hypothetical protein